MPMVAAKPSWFAPWQWARRPFGVFAAVLTCALFAGWIRSQFREDTFVVSVGTTWGFSVVSECGYLDARAAAYGDKTPPMSFYRNSRPADTAEKYDPWSRISVPYLLNVPGLFVGCDGINIFQPMYFAVCLVSYWLVIVLLAGASAGLLLFDSKKDASTSLEK